MQAAIRKHVISILFVKKLSPEMKTLKCPRFPLALERNLISALHAARNSLTHLISVNTCSRILGGNLTNADLAARNSPMPLVYAGMSVFTPEKNRTLASFV
jgi:hypothetical protein